jgi:hypothetical protein
MYCAIIVQYSFYITVEKSAVISPPAYMVVFIFFGICTSHVNAEFINPERPFNTWLLASGVTEKTG